MTPPVVRPFAGDVGPPSIGLGLILFGIYAILFAAFLIVNVAGPDFMTLDSVPLSSQSILSLKGMNLSIVLGLGLILASLVFVLIFMRLTRQRRD